MCGGIPANNDITNTGKMLKPYRCNRKKVAVKRSCLNFRPNKKTCVSKRKCEIPSLTRTPHSVLGTHPLDQLHPNLGSKSFDFLESSAGQL